MTTRHKTIGEMLKDRRKELGHNRSEAARALGVSRQIYPTWETGHAVPREEFIPPIAIYLELDEDTLALQRYHEKLNQGTGVSLYSLSRPSRTPVAA